MVIFMKKCKRLIALVFALHLMSLTVPVWGAESGESAKYNSDLGFSKVNSYIPGQFSDISDGQWYAQGVQTAYEYGLMSGVSNTLFNPEGNLTVAEAITIACRIHSFTWGNNASFQLASP